MPIINGVYLKDFTALPGAVADANIIPIAISGNQIAYRTTVAGIVTDARITSKLLTGLSITGGAVVAADTILAAFGKVQNQINDKQGTITLTTTGTSGASTLVGNTLNVPNYADGGVLSLSAIGAVPNANAATITGTVLNLQPASASFGGVVTTGTQTFEGSKTFSVDLIVNGLNIGKGLNSVSTNTSIGVSALNANTTGGVNTAIGRFALTANTEGDFNTAVGGSSLTANTTGSGNSAFGYVSLTANTTGTLNAALGNLSLTANTTGAYNSAIGYSALASNTTGSYNVGVGYTAGNFVNAGTDNITSGTSVYIGADTRASASGNTNEIVIGYEGRGNGSNTVTIGNSSIANNYFIGNVRGGAFIKTGGTSAQFLKADGTVDSGTYGSGTVTSVAALTLGTSGTDLSSTVATGTTTPVITLNVPDASATNRGVITTGSQTIAGDKTLTGALVGTTGSFASSGGSDSFAINHSSGAGIALNITKGGNGEGIYVNKTSGSGNAVTIIGTLNATTLVKSGGTSSQFLMADGSVNTSVSPTGAYLPLTGGTLTGALLGTSASFSSELNLGGTLSNSASDKTTGINLKQAGNTSANGIYLERTGERTGYYIYVGGGLDALTFQRNYAGTKSDVLALNRDGTITASGAATFSSTIAATSATFSGLVDVSKSGQAIRILASSTDATYQQIQNTSGNMIVGNESSVGGVVFSGTTTYSGIIGTASTKDFFIGTNSTQRVKIDGTSGAATFTSTSVTIGSGGGSGELTLAQSGVRNWGLSSGGITSGHFSIINGSDGLQKFGINGTTNVVTINALGSGTVTATSGVLSAVSDMNLKIEDGFIDNALEKVLNLKPRYFNWKEKSGLPTDIRQLGFYAQEVNEALGEEAANTPKNKNDKWGIYDRALIAMLTKAIQELSEKITQLENK